MTITSTFGGAIYQGNCGMMGFGTYSPYSVGGFVPSYGYGWGVVETSIRVFITFFANL